MRGVDSGHSRPVAVNSDHMIPLLKLPISTVIKVRRAMLVAALVGLFTSTYLLVAYVTNAPIVCGTSSSCDLVRASKWAYTYGIPRPALGILFYAALILLLAGRVASPERIAKKMSIAVWIVGFFGFIESAFLFVVQWLDIRAYCIWCLTSAICATIIFALSWVDHDEPLHGSRAVAELRMMAIVLAVFAACGAVVLYFLVAPRVGGGIPMLTG